MPTSSLGFIRRGKSSKRIRFWRGSKTSQRDRSDSKDSKDSKLSKTSENQSVIVWTEGEKTGNNGQNSKFVKERKRRPSKLAILLFGPTKLPVVDTTAAMLRLETVIKSEGLRKQLVQEIVAIPGNFIIKIRFCVAVDHYISTQQKEEKKNLAKKLIETFLEPHSMFLVNIDEDRRQAIVFENQMSQLLEAKKEILLQLSLNSQIMAIVDDL